MLIVAFGLAYFLSTYITKLENYLRPNQRNQFEPKKKKNSISSKEINLLIKSYNRMVEELEISAIKLAQSEREEAWREMAKQVAHEIPVDPNASHCTKLRKKI
jgi:nitrogen fixation/metabolism regulation signal transduction histidine kinase